MRNETESAWWALRLALGIGPVVAGADKFFNLITDWSMYLSPLAAGMLPVAPSTFMHVIGLVEIAVGVAILTKGTRIGAWVAMAWLIGIAVNLLSTGMFFDLAVRDLEIAVAAYALARLSALRESMPSHSHELQTGTLFEKGLV